MAKSIVTLKIDTVVNGKKQVQDLTVDLTELQRSSERVRRSLERKISVTAYDAVSNAAATLGGAMSSLQGVLKGLSDAYAVQESVESRLATTMRQRMNATDDEIDSIKALAAAQQELGVIGDEVQLAGAQEIAMFVSQRESIEALLPAINDLAAHQRGLNVTSADTEAIAKAMGKAMAGQTTALRRMGIILDEVQEATMKYGSELDKAATLAHAVENAVGHVNAELAKTDTGRVKQLENALGDVKEQIGGIVQGALPFVTLAGNAAVAALGVVKLGAAFKAVLPALDALKAKAVAATASFRALGMAQQIAFGAGVGILIMGVANAIDRYRQRTEAAGRAAKILAEKHRELEQSASDITEATSRNAAKEMAALERLYAVAKDDAKSKKDRQKAIKELQDMFPGYFADIDIEKGKVAGLKTEYEALQKSILDTARARAAEEKIVENQKALLDKEDELANAQALRLQATKDLLAAKDSGDKKQVAFAQGVLATYDNLVYAIEADIDTIKEKNEQLADIVNNAPTGRMGTVTPTPTNTAKATPSDRDRAAALDVTEIMSRNCESVADFDQVLSDLRLKSRYVGEEEYASIAKNIESVEELRRKFMGLPSAIKAAEAPLTLEDVTKRAMTCLADYDQALTDLAVLRSKASKDDIANLNELIEAYRKARGEFAGETPKPATNAKRDPLEGMSGFDKLKFYTGSLDRLGGGLQSITRIADDSASVWERLSAGINGVISAIEGVSGVIKILKDLGIVSSVSGAAQTAALEATTEAAEADATAQIEDAAAKTFNAHAWLPWVGIALGAASVAAMVATMAGLPKFAEGGIAYGPTVGMFGEYPGAASNPEVVAPLSKLRDLITPAEPMRGEVRFVLEGRQLVGLINAYSRLERRTE